MADVDHGGHVPAREGPVGRAEEVHEQAESQAALLSLLPEEHKTLHR